MSLILYTFDPQLPELEEARRRAEFSEAPGTNSERLLQFGLLALLVGAPEILVAAGVTEVNAAALWAIAQTIRGTINAGTGLVATTVATINIAIGRDTSENEMGAFRTTWTLFDSTNQVLDIGERGAGVGMAGSLRDRYMEELLKPSRAVSPTVPGAVSLRYRHGSAGEEPAQCQQMRENDVEGSGAKFGVSVSSDGKQWWFYLWFGASY